MADVADFTTNPNFRSLNFKDNRPTLLNQSLSGRRQVRQIGSQYFSFTVQMPPLQQDKAQEIFAFLQKQKGSSGDFTIGAPLDNLGAGKAESDIQVVGSHVAGDASIDLDGFAASQANALKAGDLVRFNGHSKVYMVQNNIDSNADGSLQLMISPNLVTSLANNEAVVVNKPRFKVYLENNEIMYSTDASGFYSISFDVREVIT
jgi:hypothetical protein